MGRNISGPSKRNSMSPAKSCTDGEAALNGALGFVSSVMLLVHLVLKVAVSIANNNDKNENNNNNNNNNNDNVLQEQTVVLNELDNTNMATGVGVGRAHSYLDGSVRSRRWRRTEAEGVVQIPFSHYRPSGVIRIDLPV